MKKTPVKKGTKMGSIKPLKTPLKVNPLKMPLKG